MEEEVWKETPEAWESASEIASLFGVTTQSTWLNQHWYTMNLSIMAFPYIYMVVQAVGSKDVTVTSQQASVGSNLGLASPL